MQLQYTTLAFENSGEKHCPVGKQEGTLEGILVYESTDLDSTTITVTQESNFVSLGIHFLISIKLNCGTRL